MNCPNCGAWCERDEPSELGDKRAEMEEFCRIYNEAQVTARDHAEFLKNIFDAAVNLSSGKWVAPE